MSAGEFLNRLNVEGLSVLRRDKDREASKKKDKRKKHARAGDIKEKDHPWALDSAVNHVTFSGRDGEDMIAWYVAEPQQWSFRSRSEGEQLIRDGGATLAELQGTRLHLRVTSRPYPVSQWARACWDNAPEPQDGFAAMMENDQRWQASSAQADKLVYWGVELGRRSAAVRHLGKVTARATEREMEALQERLDHVDGLMAGVGIEARPASGKDMEWLIMRSLALGCPIPAPDLSAPDFHEIDSGEIAGYASSVEWSAEPLADSVKITTTIAGKRIDRHVVILTVGRMHDFDVPVDHEPWIAKTDRFPFPVEWAATIEVRTPEEISREMSRQADRIDSQWSHYVDDHNKRPPKQLSRQADRASDIEDEQRRGFDGLSTRVKAWYRIAVSGATEDEALERADRVIKAYKTPIILHKTKDQYFLAREFVPGEPLANTSYSRKHPIEKLTAGVPAVTSEVGDKRGFHIGETCGITKRSVFFDPWYLMEEMEQGGLIPIVATPGGGKSKFMFALLYKAVQSGVCGAGMDPAGRLARLCALPEMRGISHVIDVLGGEPGTLSPYAVVPEPREEYVRLDCLDPNDPDELAMRMARAKVNAEASRRDLALYTARWTLPQRLADKDATLDLLDDAISSTRADVGGSLNEARNWLNARRDDDETARRIVQHLDKARDHEIGQLMFRPEGAHARDADDYIAGLATARFVAYNLRGLAFRNDSDDVRADAREELRLEEALSRPVQMLASYQSLNVIYRRDPNERKVFGLDEMREMTEGSSTGRAFTAKVSSDARKNNTAALVATQNAATVLAADVNNYIGACFVGRTVDEQCQRDALRMLGKPEGCGYEESIANLSHRPRNSPKLPYREFIYQDGLGGDEGRGGMEKIRVQIDHHPGLKEALDTTADPGKIAERKRQEKTEAA